MKVCPQNSVRRAHRAFPRRRLLVCLLVVSGTLVASYTGAQCTNCTPATPVPPDRWGELEPRDITIDTTFFNFQSEPGCAEPMPHDVEVEGGRMFVAAGNSVLAYKLNPTPGTPRPIGDGLCRPVLGTWKHTDQDFYINEVEAAPGRGDWVVAGIDGGMGVIMAKVTNSSMTLMYQDEGRIGVGSGEVLSVVDLHATSVGGRDIAYASASSSQRILAYDITAARSLERTCHEGSQNNNIRCAGVYRGVVRSSGNNVLSRRKIAGTGRFLLTVNSGIVTVYEFRTNNPTNATLLGNGGSAPLDFDMWEHGGRVFYALAHGQEVSIWEVPCPGGTCGAPVLLSTIDTPGGLNAVNSRTPTNKVRASIGNGSPFLFAGSNQRLGRGPQREYLFDMSDVEEPREITPQTSEDGYWGWYYQDNATGFHNVAPRAGVVWSNHFYRAAWSILDVHEILGPVPPETRIGLPSGLVYGGDTVELQDLSSGSPTSWAWDFKDNGTVDSTEQHPTWTVPESSTYPRGWPIRLTACNQYGCADSLVNLVAHDPAVPEISIDEFRAIAFCSVGRCFVDQGAEIEFRQQFTGSPTRYDYDWDGDGHFEDAGNPVPKTHHTYYTAGSFTPRMRARRSTVEVERGHAGTMEVASVQGAPIFADGFESSGLSEWTTSQPE